MILTAFNLSMARDSNKVFAMLKTNASADGDKLNEIYTDKQTRAKKRIHTNWGIKRNKSINQTALVDQQEILIHFNW